MKITFSDHAREQMRERNITEAMILRTVINPDKVTKQSRGRSAAHKLMGENGKKYLLIAVYDESGSTREIVTAFFTTKFKKYL